MGLPYGKTAKAADSRLGVIKRGVENKPANIMTKAKASQRTASASRRQAAALERSGPEGLGSHQ